MTGPIKASLRVFLSSCFGVGLVQGSKFSFVQLLMKLIEFSQQALQNWLYYLVSTMTDNISELCMPFKQPGVKVPPIRLTNVLARLSGILRGQESFSQAVSFGLNTRNWHGGRVPLAVNTILLGMCLIFTEIRKICTDACD